MSQLSADEVLQRMDGMGMSLEIAAAITGRPLSEVKQVIRSKRFVPEDAQIASAMRQLAWRVWGMSMNILENGHPDQQQAIIRIVLGRTAGLIGEESDTTMEEQKEALARILSTNRVHVDALAFEPESLPVPQDDDHYVEPTPTFSGAYDSGQEPESDEDSVRPDYAPDWGDL